ncbi:MAG TPA: hypothetical protein VGL75_05395 [Acidothermaceae bacterium]|jgi:hypothetical protein
MAIDEVTPSPSLPFQEWQRALAALRSAEARGDSHPEILRLSAEVIRTRNELTVDRLHAGWHPPDDILKHLTVDAHLLHEKDDTTRT